MYKKILRDTNLIDLLTNHKNINAPKYFFEKINTYFQLLNNKLHL